jgi:hypothetical protein
VKLGHDNKVLVKKCKLSDGSETAPFFLSQIRRKSELELKRGAIVTRKGKVKIFWYARMHAIC